MADLENMENFFSTPEDSIQLDEAENRIQLEAKTGDLFEPDIPRDQWEKFCVAAEKAEIERTSFVPEKQSRVTDEERKLLARADTFRDEQAEALLEKREKLARTVRPQCTDPNDQDEADEVEKLVNEEFGIEDWGSIDTSIGGGV